MGRNGQGPIAGVACPPGYLQRRLPRRGSQQRVYRQLHELRTAITKQGKHGRLFLFTVDYFDPTDSGFPPSSTKVWAYNFEHVYDLWASGAEGFEISSGQACGAFVKITQAVVFSLYAIAIEADDAWSDNLAAARVHRYGTASHAVAGYAAKVQADRDYHAALNVWRQMRESEISTALVTM